MEDKNRVVSFNIMAANDLVAYARACAAIVLSQF